MNPPVIEVKGLTKRYGDTLAVKDVSFDVNAGEIFGILGPNGAGKTTTIEVLTGLRHIDGGQVRVLGVDPQADPRRIREHVGIQLQHAQLPGRLRVAEALQLYGSFYCNPADPIELMDLLGLTSQCDQAFEELSGGQQQRLSIALALVGNPQIAVLDELTTGLDPQARRATWSLIEKIRDRGVTIILVTHLMDEAERLCDRVCVINHGEIVAMGSPADLLAARSQTYLLELDEDFSSPTVSRWLSESPLPHLRRSGTGLEVDGTPADLSHALASLIAAGVCPTGINVRTRSLEDLVIELSATPVPDRESVVGS